MLSAGGNQPLLSPRITFHTTQKTTGSKWLWVVIWPTAPTCLYTHGVQLYGSWSYLALRYHEQSRVRGRPALRRPAVWISIRWRDTERRDEGKKQRKLHHKSPAALSASEAEIHLCLSLSPSKLRNVTLMWDVERKSTWHVQSFFAFFAFCFKSWDAATQSKFNTAFSLSQQNAPHIKGGFTAGQWFMMQKSSTPTGGEALNLHLEMQ